MLLYRTFGKQYFFHSSETRSISAIPGRGTRGGLGGYVMGQNALLRIYLTLSWTKLADTNSVAMA